MEAQKASKIALREANNTLVPNVRVFLRRERFQRLFPGTLYRRAGRACTRRQTGQMQHMISAARATQLALLRGGEVETRKVGHSEQL